MSDAPIYFPSRTAAEQWVKDNGKVGIVRPFSSWKNRARMEAQMGLRPEHEPHSSADLTEAQALSLKAMVAVQSDTASRTPRSGGPSAKSICLSIYSEGISKEEFLIEAGAAGVKESTARTMYSDIKAGRIK